ncbi:sulfatase/phosphatase domain-containing protein [uncultured Tateyamaria sp.]|uniref:sulfatase/phosphatase domain-containing protein n=1 Tax=uncultured Tateyamaria sp. TaxID=455651 RepID=UPI0026257CA7|nr:sulfatase/phosphatase domain-containing protein [uncultured Tateyamaria sp.]
MDPSKDAEATRGQVITDLTEAIDLAPTFVEYFGGKVPDHILEGRSLLPSLHGKTIPPRAYAISEYDYSTRAHLRHLSPNAKSCLLTMVFDGRWKMIWVEGHRPMLFDLETDPDEFVDLGANEKYANEITRLSSAMFDWSRRQHNRVTLSDEKIDTHMCHDDAVEGVYLGFWDEDELAAWKAEQEPKPE